MTYQRVIEEKYPLIAFDFDIGRNIIIHGNPMEIQQAISNLMNNAIEATVENSAHIELSIASVANQIEIRVHDSGTGIKQEHLTRIFDPFYTTKNTMEKRGLGLYEVRRIVQKHLGSVYVENGLSGGAVFTIVLPRAEKLI